ncbi:MAG: VCBS domain-containing protein, partial [Gammaproteobacteria bacterium]|nr:VCBS domain-containing protein [Gammaproteobacteria bacterium]
TYGSVTESGGNWTYTLNNANATVQALADGETLVDTITFTSDDGTTATQAITITGTNDAATITVSPVDTAVTEDDLANQTASGMIAISDVDNGEGTLVSSVATYGTVTVDGSGNWTYTLDNGDPVVNALAAGETLVDTITFTSDDGTTATQAITITGANDAPTVTDDYYVVADNTTLTVNSTSGLLINDIDPDGDSLSVTEIGFGSNSYSVPASGSVTITTTNGELTVSSDGSFVYTPASADVLGVEDFTYTVTDSQGASTNASFGVEVDAVAENPTLVSASLGNNGYAYSVAEDKATGSAFLWQLDMVTGDITKIGLAQSIELDTTIGLPASAAAGDTLTVVAEGETVQIVLTAADITNGSVSVTFHPTGAGSNFTASASLTDASGNTTPSGIASALIDHVPSNAPSVTITEDSNNNRIISATELAGDLNVAIGIPSSALAGDVITITDGTTTTALVLTSADISSGNITTTFGAPVEGSTITVHATHTDGSGNVSETGIDSALLNTLGVDAPTVSINKDGDGDGFIDFGTLKVQELDIEGLTYDPATDYLYGMGTGQHPGLFAFSKDEAYIAQNGGSAVVREYLELSGPNNDLLDINSGSMGGTIGPGDTLYYTNVEGNSSILYSIDKATGEVTEFGDLGEKTGAFDFYQETAEFLGLVTSTNKTYLHSFDLSDPGNITNTQLFEIGQNLDIQGMSPGPNGNLWALDRATGEIYEIDINTGTVSLLVSTAVNELQGDGFESLAVGPRPNNLEPGAEFTYNLSANFGTNNLAEEIHYFLVHLPDAAMSDGLTFPTGQPNTSLVTLAAGNNYGLTAGTYVRIEADPTIDASGTAEVSIILEAPVSSDSFELSVYAVEEDTRVDLNLATNFAVTQAADDQTFVTTYDIEISGSFADGLEGTSILGSNLTDSISGNAGDDIIFGADNDDWISGGAGSDKLNGGAGADILIGGSGDDSLIGGDGIDIFALESGDEGTVGTPAVDTIADFTAGVGGDVLDLSDMLQGEDLGSLDGFLNFSYDGAAGATIINIDVDGDTGTFETSQQIVLSGVDLTAGGTLTDADILNNLLNDGNLIVNE